MMYVYFGNAKAPICVESNMAFAVPYWTARKLINPNLRWVFK